MQLEDISEDEQFKMVNESSLSIKQIANPTIAVQLAAVKMNG